MKALSLTAALVSAALLAAGCGSSDSPPKTADTEGLTLQEAQQVLVAEGVAPTSISVEGENVPTALVCDHDPDGVETTVPTTLYAASDCDSAYGPGGVLAAALAAGKIKKHTTKRAKAGAATALIQKASKAAKPKSSGSGSGSSSSSKKSKKRKR
ncbi:hypothetical protein DSM112329_02528 [Paraconexibacter sp. AEG42_29]|uniref:PASTA domain-containing protein n=1 Tax=Paraconexibacter sp. AEG42_29 TaxID=2997339 RepID=A0AAU7AVC6_9ACTN